MRFLVLFFVGFGGVLAAQQNDDPRLRKDETSAWEDSPRHVWYLKFTHEKPKCIVVGQEWGNPRIYWYMVYTIENLDNEDHEIFVEVSASSDKGVTYIDSCEEDVYKAVVWKEGMKEWRGPQDTGKPGVLHPVDALTMFPSLARYKGPLNLEWQKSPPVKIGRTHGDPKDLGFPVIKAGQKWRCVAIFKMETDPLMDRFRIRPPGRYSWDPEARHIRIRVWGLTNDFRLITHEDRDRLRFYLRNDCVITRDGREFWGRVEEMVDAYKVTRLTPEGQTITHVIPKEKVWRYLPWNKAKLRKGFRRNENDLSRYMRIVVHKYYQIIYERRGSDLFPDEQEFRLVDEGWVEDWSVIRLDNPHMRIWEKHLEERGGTP